MEITGLASKAHQRVTDTLSILRPSKKKKNVETTDTPLCEDPFEATSASVAVVSTDISKSDTYSTATAC